MKFEFETEDAAKLEGLEKAAAQAGKTSQEYVQIVMDGATASYARQFGVTEPTTLEAAKGQIATLKAALEEKQVELDATKANTDATSL